MGLTRPRAHQLQDIDYKQTSRAITTTNITLSGGAPAVVDGVSLGLNDRVLVTGQSTGSENGIYSVTTVGAGSNGTWARSSDADGAGELNAGSITMVTEGTTYADTQWKLTTDDPITIGSTALTFVRNGAAAYGVFAVAGQSDIVADAVGDTLTIVAGTNIALTTNASTDTLTITPSLTPAVTTLDATGNITGGNLITAGSITLNQLSLNSDLTTVSPLQLTAGSLQDGVGALRIDAVEPDIYLNDTNSSGHSTVTFATGNVAAAAIGKNNNEDFYITVNTGSGWLDTTFIADHLTGNISLGYNLAVTGNITAAGLALTTATFTNTTTDDTILLTTTEDSSTAGPVITLKRNSASPADADYMGQLKFKGENDADQEVVYAKVTAKIQDASDGSEDGIIEFANMKAGSNVITARLRSDSLQLLNGTTLVVAGLTYPTADGTDGQFITTDGSGNLSFSDGGSATEEGKYPNSTVKPVPGSDGNFDLAKQYDQTGSAETPFEDTGSDAFGVSLGQVYSLMDPVGDIPTATDLGVLS
jgi:hypothetical protein